MPQLTLYKLIRRRRFLNIQIRVMAGRLQTLWRYNRALDCIHFASFASCLPSLVLYFFPFPSFPSLSFPFFTFLFFKRQFSKLQNNRKKTET